MARKGYTAEEIIGRSPRSARAFSRAGRDETTASSDIARRPFKTIKATTTTSSRSTGIRLLTGHHYPLRQKRQAR